MQSSERPAKRLRGKQPLPQKAGQEVHKDQEVEEQDNGYSPDSQCIDEAEKVGEENSLQMMMETVMQGGGRQLAVLRQGTLYEVASRSEKQEWEEECFDDGPMPAGCYMTKSSVEGSRTRESQATKDFLCEGTMYRHTRVSWKDAPMEFKKAHAVKASKSEPVVVVKYQHKIEDLTPFDREVYWKTIWRKCAACHGNDIEFKNCIVRSTRQSATSASSGCPTARGSKPGMR